MARRRPVARPGRALATPAFLLAAQLLSVASGPTLVSATSSILADANVLAPEYATRYAPLVWLHSDDAFRPSDLLEHVLHTAPMVDQNPISGLPELNLENLAVLNDVGGRDVAMTSRDNVTTLPSWFFGEAPDDSGRIHEATPCAVVLVETSPQDVDAFYFYFYSYNRGANVSQVLEPVNRLLKTLEPGMNFGDHVGDWEHNMVRFRDGKPVGIYYSQHESGAAYSWQDTTLSMRDERPVTFSAYGSHANYPSEGDHVHDSVMVDHCDAGLIWDPVLSAYFFHFDPDSHVLTYLPNDSTSPPAPNMTSFLDFDGMWGDAQYPDDHPLQQTVPYFGLKRFNSGPTGPTDKQLVRKGLSPDHRKPKSWVAWGVDVFMSWYPCCLRGWRVWMSGAVLVSLIVLIVLGIRYTVRWYKLRRYTKVETEVPLEDFEILDDASISSEDDQHERATREDQVEGSKIGLISHTKR